MMRILKKLLNIILIIGILFSNFIPIVYASELKKFVIINEEYVGLREGPSTSTTRIENSIPFGSYEYLDEAPSGNGCDKNWYEIKYSSSVSGYVCGEYATIQELDVKEYEGVFPDSYKPSLAILKAKYPNWEFIPVNTGLDFNEAALRQSKDHRYGSALIDTANEGWRSVSEYSGYDWENDYWPGMDGESWKAANKEVVAYYMDPRNFLNESEIFQFEELFYNPYIDETDVKYALRNTFMTKYDVYPGTYLYNGVPKTYSSTFIESAEKNGINPVFLATRVRQEVVLSGGHPSGSVSGTVKGYQGYYNFFNIGASKERVPGVQDPVINGLMYAKDRGWDNPYKSITEGVGGTLIDVYIKKEAQTRYFQKFNVNPERWKFYPVHTIQYMTNIRAPYSEGKSAYNAYKQTGKINPESSFKFLIPIFNHMPETTTLPHTGNPNFYLKDLRINGKTIDGFVYDKADYKVSVPLAVNSINIDGSPINSKASISGSGNIQLNTQDNKVDIVVTAENGNKFTYKINVVKEDIQNIPIDTILDNSGIKYNDKYISGIKIGTNVSSLINNVKKVSSFASIQIFDNEGKLKTNAAFKTGDKVVISSNNTTKEYKIVIYGDIDGDGEITKIDLLLLQRHVFGYSKLQDVKEESANIDKNEKIDRVDLLLLQRHVFGYSKIVQ